MLVLLWSLTAVAVAATAVSFGRDVTGSRRPREVDVWTVIALSAAAVIIAVILTRT